MKNLKSQLPILLLCAVCLLSSAYGQLTPSADAYTNTADPTTNYGAKTLLDVESSQTTYIQFNLSSIPSGYTSADITKATLKLYVNSVTTAGSFNVDYVNGTWSENTIDSSNAPAFGTTITASVPLTSADKNQYILIDVTTAVQAWLSGTANDGLALVGNSPVNATFDSKESTTTSHAAELDIVFTPGSGGGGGIAGIITASGSGLMGGGTSGTLNLSLINTCAAKQILQWTGSAWACASPGTGTVTSVGSGAGLTGGPITSSGTLSIANAGVSNSMLTNPSLTISPGTALTGGGSVALGGSTTLSLDTSKVPLLAAANTFAASQTVHGTVTATSFSGNGAALTNVTANNSNELGGQAPSAFAQIGLDNSFGTNQAIFGTLTVQAGGIGVNASTGSTTSPAVQGYGQTEGVLGSDSVGSGIGYGVEGVTQSTGGVGVGGYAVATTGTTYGVYGYGTSPASFGVYGISPNVGIEGYSTSTTAVTYGVTGTNSSTSGSGVYGSSPNIGVQGVGAFTGVYGAGEGSSQSGRLGGSAGVWGDTGGTGGPAAVLGTADGTYAGFFINNSSVYPTLYTQNNSTNFGGRIFEMGLAGVDASATMGDPGCNVGFIGLQLGQGGMSNCDNYTITGGNNGSTYVNAVTGGAVHLRISNVEELVASSGNVSISGNLSATGTKNFRIDHPLDPANKYLTHAAIESSEVLNLYSGNVVLDASGEAVVQLPDWFEVINKDYRYQLTSIGAPGRDLYVADEVSEGRFKVAGGKAGGKVSWQVSGVRNDAWEKAHPMVVEADKGTERGQYLTPELYGAPETARIGYMAPAPESEKVVLARPTTQGRGNSSPALLRTPPSLPIPPSMPVAPKVSPRPHPAAQSGKPEANQK